MPTIDWRDRGRDERIRGALASTAQSQRPMTVYIAEDFTADEADILRRYFTNLDQPVLRLSTCPRSSRVRCSPATRARRSAFVACS